MPHYDESGDHWPADDVIWRGYHKGARNAEMHRQIAAGASHLIREVVLRHPDYTPPYDRRSITSMLDWADDEYALIRAAGIAVPDVRWRVVTDYQRRLRVLARVPVVTGITLSAAPDLYDELIPKLDVYDATATGERLLTLRDGEQFVHGIIAESAGLGQSQTYLVDIDPM